MTHVALDKKSNFEFLEKDVGLHKFLPSPVISNNKVSKRNFSRYTFINPLSTSWSNIFHDNQ